VSLPTLAGAGTTCLLVNQPDFTRIRYRHSGIESVVYFEKVRAPSGAFVLGAADMQGGSRAAIIPVDKIYGLIVIRVDGNGQITAQALLPQQFRYRCCKVAAVEGKGDVFHHSQTGQIVAAVFERGKWICAAAPVIIAKDDHVGGDDAGGIHKIPPPIKGGVDHARRVDGNPDLGTILAGVGPFFQAHLGKGGVGGGSGIQRHIDGCAFAAGRSDVRREVIIPDIDAVFAGSRTPGDGGRLNPWLIRTEVWWSSGVGPDLCHQRRRGEIRGAEDIHL
jgi:hypothetical protein